MTTPINSEPRLAETGHEVPSEQGVLVRFAAGALAAGRRIFEGTAADKAIDWSQEFPQTRIPKD